MLQILRFFTRKREKKKKKKKEKSIEILPEFPKRSLLRTSSGSYPYPRSHSTVMVLPSLRPIDHETNDEETTSSRLRPTRRPPLNRAIPTIPESRSNESIMTQNSERKDSKVVTPVEDRCVIIENRMADSITARITTNKPNKTMLPKLSGSSRGTPTSTTTTSIPKPNTKKSETPRSPLMSVAHSVRNKLSKLGRLGRSEEGASGSSIKGSRSMISMRSQLASKSKEDKDSSYKMAKSHSMEASSSKESAKETKLRMPSKVGVLRKSASREMDEDPKMDEEEEDSTKHEENIRKSVAIVRATYRQASTSIVLRDPTSTTSTILAVEETIILPTTEITKPTELSVKAVEDQMRDSGVVAGSPDDKAEAPDLIHEGREADFELARDLLEDPEDEIPMDTGLTPMSETSTLYLQPFGHPEVEPLRLKRVKEETEAITKKEIYRIKAEVEPSPIVLSETSTIILSPDGEGDLLRLKKIHSERPANPEPLAERPNHKDVEELAKNVANFCLGQPRTNSLVSHNPSVLDLVPENQRGVSPIHLQKMLSKTTTTRPEEISSMFKQVAAFCMSHPRTDSLVPSEASTLYLLPIGEESNEPIRLRKLHSDGREEVAETPDDVQKIIKDVAAFCMKQPRTNSICLSDASSVHLLPLGGTLDEMIRVKKVHTERSAPESPKEEHDVLRDIAVFCWAQPRRDSIAGSDVSSLCLMPLGGDEKIHLKKLHLAQTVDSSPIREMASPDDVGHILINEIAACCMNPRRPESISTSEASSLYLAPLGSSSPQIVHLKKERLTGMDRVPEDLPLKVQQPAYEQRQQRTNDLAAFCLRKPEVESIVLSETSTLCLEPIGEEGEMIRLKKIHNKDTIRPPPNRPFQMDESVLTIDTTPMSEASTLLWANVGREHEEANMLRLKRVRDALEKHIDSKRKQLSALKQKQDPIVLSETSTLMLVPIDDEQAEPLRLKKVHNQQAADQLSPQKGDHKVLESQIISPCSSQGAVSTESNLENIEPTAHKKEAPPVFHVPAPPPRESLHLEHKGTSPLRKPNVSAKVPPKNAHHVEPIKETKGASKLRQSVSMREEKFQETTKKETKTPRTPLTARSLKNFLLKKDKVKITKPLPTSATMPLSPRQNLTLRLRQNAPLAETESSVIENSPHVELPPMRFGQWSSSPRGRRRTVDRPPSHLALFDKNGNNMRGQRDVSNTSVRSTQEPGLIDDEIRDQPMLVGDSFSTSNSMDQIAATVTMMRSSYEPEHDRSTIMSIDRSTIDEQNNEQRRSYHESPAPPASQNSHLSTIYSPPPANQKQIEASLAEVEAMRAQLVALQSALAQITPESPTQNKQGQIGCCELARENDVLRRQLSEKDRIISQLREQLAITKITH